MAKINAKTTGSGGIETVGDASGVLELQTAGTTRQYIDASGNVGIGTSSPSAFNGSGLEISRTGGNATLTLTRTGNTSSDIRSGVQALTFNVDPQNVVADSFLQFSVDNTERMRIDTDGRLLVNRTTALGSGNIQVTNVNLSAIGAERTGSVGPVVIFYDDGTDVGSIDVAGTSTSYTTSSDYRLKENIAPMVGALDTVAQLNPVTYKWKADGSDGQGFIAHELQEVVPECVSGEKDAVDAEGNPEYQGVDTSFLVATLTAAIQEQQAIITEQSGAIANLKARIEVLEGASA
jgi:azurin